MGLNTFSTGLSGLNTNGQGLAVVGNNLANLNTVGFKSSNISFSEVLNKLGSQVSGVHTVFGQGATQTTNNPLDVAIQGRGFLVQSNDGALSYSRNGNLHLDADGFLVGENGFKIQGYQRNASTGLIDQNVADIQVPAGLMPPTPTSQFQLGMNLDANAATGTQFSATVQLYDSQGNSHMATLAMEKDVTGGATPTTLWRFDVTIPESEVAGASPTSTAKYSLITGAVATATPSAGALAFDNAGTLISAYTGADPATLPALADVNVSAATMANGAALSPITWQLANVVAGSGITGFASPSEMSVLNTNGAAAGSMSSIAVMPDGTLSAAFSNGKVIPVGQIVLAQFANMEGLLNEGAGNYRETTESGISRIGVPGDSGLGRVMGGALEQSNVDMAAELTKIITYQRGYQASARIITTGDQILQETLNIMR